MDKAKVARELARRAKTSRGKAADEIDDAISELLHRLRRGDAARLPGLGTISPDKDWTFKPERQ